MTKFRLGLDIGGSKTHAILLDGKLTVLAEELLPSGHGAEPVLATAVQAANRCVARAGLQVSEVTSIGVGIPGRVDPIAGTVHTAVNLELSELRLGPELAERLGVPVAVENDVKAAALGAAAVLDEPELAYLNFGTGVAAAVVRAGKLVRGRDNLAGEIGHLPIDPAGELCSCGQHGCLETSAGGRYLTARLAAAGLDLTTLIAAAATDPIARAEADRLTDAIVSAILVLVLSHGPDVVALAGGVTQHCPGLFDRLRDDLEARAATSAFLGSLDVPSRLRLVPPERPVAAIGAALAGRQANAVILL